MSLQNFKVFLLTEAKKVKNKGPQIYKKSTLRQLAQIARRHSDKTIGRKAKKELDKRKASIKGPGKKAIAHHLGLMAIGKKRRLDPSMAAHLKTVSPKTIAAAVKKHVAEVEKQKPIKRLERQLKKREAQLAQLHAKSQNLGGKLRKTKKVAKELEAKVPNSDKKKVHAPGEHPLEIKLAAQKREDDAGWKLKDYERRKTETENLAKQVAQDKINAAKEAKNKGWLDQVFDKAAEDNRRYFRKNKRS